eukprot:CAMPEP_0206286590 /NCGR_PEP_ID=MMETSP0106_2-20121207/678_1 /ASSEMBLY_ACC=CAM_ASM_000206 /TAXON_ID=81532 /ORGANISM="Acanthoeca-like sp., Strain 10tr" /LENGTH=187 /DNA_ID=CAMNT_0053717115 /DNA_START=133 /DNA_END=693 /DNA_ORIENTATION=-
MLRAAGKLDELEQTITTEVTNLIAAKRKEYGLPDPALEVENAVEAQPKAKKAPPQTKLSAKRAAKEKALDDMAEALRQVYVEATRPQMGSSSASFSTFDILNREGRPAFVGKKQNVLDLKTIRQRVAERRYKDARTYLADVTKIASYATNAKKAKPHERFEAYQMVRTFHDEIQRRGLVKLPVPSRP